MIRPFERRRRVLTPGHATWKRAGGIIAELMAAKRLSREGVGRSFVNDCMLAASAQEYGFVLITGNIRSPARGPPQSALEFDAKHT